MKPVTRVTQRMMSDRSVAGMQSGLARLARVQEQLSTGRVLNRPSDSPTDTAMAMRLNDSLSATRQYQCNGQDGTGWLARIDDALASAGTQLGRARDLVLQGANAVNASPSAREALAIEIDQVRTDMIATANATYLDRPVFGGVTAGALAYDQTGAYVGTPGAVTRTVADGVRVRVDIDCTTALGPAGSSVFDHLSAASAALRGGNSPALSTSLDVLQGDLTRIVAARAQGGSALNSIEMAVNAGAHNELRLMSSPLRGAERRPAQGRGRAPAGQRSLPGRPRGHEQGHPAEPAGLSAMMSPPSTAASTVIDQNGCDVTRDPRHRARVADARLRDLQRFALVQLDDDGLLCSLSSLDDTDVRFLVAPPAPFFPDCVPELDADSVDELEIGSPADVLLLMVLTTGRSLETSTANLVAPLVVNLRTRRAL